MKRFLAVALLTCVVLFQTACTKTENAPEATAPNDTTAAGAPGSAAPTTPDNSATGTAPAAPTDATAPATGTAPATH